MSRNFLLRVASAALLLPGLIALVLWRQTLGFGLVALAAGAVGLQEYAAMTLRERPARDRAVVVVVGVLFALVIYLWPGAAQAASIAAVILVGGYQLSTADDVPGAAARFGISIAGIFYVGGLVVALPIVQRDLPAGPSWVLLAIGMTFSNDTGAYFVGRGFGRHKLAPAISPGKTIEGAVGGFFAALGFAVIARATFFDSLSLRDCLLAAVAASVLGPAGDLVESLLKRSAGVKDSGHLIPGHGGILDRLDALLFVGGYVLLHARFLH